MLPCFYVADGWYVFQAFCCWWFNGHAEPLVLPDELSGGSCLYSCACR